MLALARHRDFLQGTAPAFFSVSLCREVAGGGDDPGDPLPAYASGADKMSGRGGQDLIRGMNGEDQLSGHQSNDRLSGGKGTYRGNGGPGKDRCRRARARPAAKSSTRAPEEEHDRAVPLSCLNVEVGGSRGTGLPRVAMSFFCRTFRESYPCRRRRFTLRKSRTLRVRSFLFEMIARAAIIASGSLMRVV